MLDFQTCSALKAKGFKQDTRFIWATCDGKEWEYVYNEESKFVGSNAGYTRPGEPLTLSICDASSGNEYTNDREILDWYSCPSLEDLLAELPTERKYEDYVPAPFRTGGAGRSGLAESICSLTLEAENGRWLAYYQWIDGMQHWSEDNIPAGDTPEKALAALWLSLHP